MDASFLIPVSAGSNGAKASEAGTQPAGPNGTKPDHGSGEPSFGLVLAQVNENSPSSDSTDSSDNQPMSAKPSEEDPSAQGSLSSLQMTLALQVAAAIVQTEQTALPDTEISESDSSQDASPALTLDEALAGTTPQTVTLSLTSSQSLSIPSFSDVLGEADHNQNLSLEAGQVPDRAEIGDATHAPVTTVNAATSQTIATTVAEVTADQQGHDSGTPSGIQVKQAGLVDPGAQISLEETQAAEQGIVRVTAPQALEPARTTEPAPLAPEQHPTGTAAQPGITSASSGGTSAGDAAMNQESQSQSHQAAQTNETGTQAREGFEQARQAAAVRVDGQGKERKEPAGSLAAQPERFAGVTNDTKIFNLEGASKAAAVAPVAEVAGEPMGASPLQSLRLEVDRPDLGQVQVRLVLADQTVHAKVTTDRTEVRDFLVTRQGQLEAGLKASGLEMGEFRVDVGSQRQGQPDSGWFQGAQREFLGQGRQRQDLQDSRGSATSGSDQWQAQTGGSPGLAAWERRSVNVFA